MTRYFSLAIALSFILILAACTRVGTTQTSDSAPPDRGTPAVTTSERVGAGETWMTEVPVGDIKGEAIVAGAQDHSGTIVRIGWTDAMSAAAEELVRSLLTTTGADGACRLENAPEGAYILTFTRTGFPPVSSSGFKVERGRTTTLSPVVLADASQDITAISGRVVLIGEADNGGVLIHASTSGHTNEAVAGSDGSFALTAISAGYYRLRFTREGFAPVEREAVVEEGEYLLLPDVWLFKNGAVRGRVVYEDGRPARVVVIRWSLDRAGVKATTDEEGFYQFGNVHLGWYWLGAAVEGYVPMNQEGGQCVRVLVEPGTEAVAQDLILSPGQDDWRCP